jgi:hypothetical protein
MKRCMVLLAAVAMVFLVSHAQAEESVRQWKIKQSRGGELTGKLLEIKADHVLIEDPTGKAVSIPLWKLEGGDLIYLQRRSCRFPKITPISVKAKASQGPLISLSASGLSAGPLQKWKNRGALRGAFLPLNDPPTVATVAGRPAVTFANGPWNIMLQFQVMVADFAVPSCLTERKAFTLAAWLYNPDTPGPTETFFSCRDLDKGESTAFRYGESGRYTENGNARAGVYTGPAGRLAISDKRFPVANRWHQFVYVYTGGEAGELKLFVDGVLVASDRLDGATPMPPANHSAGPKPYMFVGAGWGRMWRWPNAPRFWYSGSIASMDLWGRALGQAELQALFKPALSQRADPPAEEILLRHIHEPPTGDYFAPEFDGLVTEPWPAGLPKNHPNAKFMEGFGQPVLTAYLDTSALAMRNAVYSVERIMQKSPAVREQFYIQRAGTNLSNGERRWVSDEFVLANYGQARNQLSDLTFYNGLNMLMHEMGHQFHIAGAMRLEDDFNERLYRTYLDAMESNKWLGDYGGNNRWEYIAVCVNQWINDGGRFHVISPRDQLRENDPAMYYFLKQYWSGDTVVDLTTDAGLTVDAAGVVQSWVNQGGSEYWGKRGWAKRPETVGAFLPLGNPTRVMRAGVPAVAFDGDDALVWDRRTKYFLAGDHEWSVAFWARRPSIEGLVPWPQTVVSFGDAKFYWGHCQLGDKRVDGKVSPGDGAWHQVVFVFNGPGPSGNGGVVSLYVDGQKQGEKPMTLSLRDNVPIVIGATRKGGKNVHGFQGVISHVRVYDYDLSKEQLVEQYEKERPRYRQPRAAIAGGLYVDLDATQLAPIPAGWHRPVYPQSLQKNWVRSWFNFGTLAGKVYNDTAHPKTSFPAYREMDKAQGIVFDGADRMVSVFVADAQVAAHPPKTYEAWLLGEGSQGTAVQWGGVTISGKWIGKGWHHLVMVADRGQTRIFLDGKLSQRAPAMKGPALGQHLHLGGRWNGKVWHDSFRGAIAQLRVHQGALTPAQIAANAALRPRALPAAPAVVESQPLILLEADALAEGPLRAWKNQGSAKGTFTPGLVGDVHAPFTQTMHHRQGVRFARDNFLISTFDLPDALKGKKPFTLFLRAYTIRNLQGAMLSWGQRGKEGFADFTFPNRRRAAAFTCQRGKGATLDKANMPVAEWWNDFVYVYQPGKGIAVYINGLLCKQAPAELNILANSKLYLGMNSHHAAPYTGVISDLAIYDVALSAERILAHWKGKASLPGKSHRLVELEAKTLPAGDVTVWKNTGQLGGAFASTIVTASAPSVQRVEGRKAVVFDGKVQFLCSSLPTPAAVTGDKPVTIVVDYLAKTSKSATVFSLAPDIVQKGFPDLTFGTGGAADVTAGQKDAFYAGTKSGDLKWKAPAPKANQWHRVTYVYTGGRRGTFRVYVDGVLNNENIWSTFGTNAGRPMHIGAAWVAGAGPRNFFPGAISRIAVYPYAKNMGKKGAPQGKTQTPKK